MIQIHKSIHVCFVTRLKGFSSIMLTEKMFENMQFSGILCNEKFECLSLDHYFFLHNWKLY